MFLTVSYFFFSYLSLFSFFWIRDTSRAQSNSLSATTAGPNRGLRHPKWMLKTRGKAQRNAIRRPTQPRNCYKYRARDPLLLVPSPPPPRLKHYINLVCTFSLHIRVARFGLFEAKKQIWPFLKLVGLEILYNLLSSWPYFRSRKVSIVKSKMLPFLKQRLAFVSYKQAPGNPDTSHKGDENWQSDTSLISGDSCRACVGRNLLRDICVCVQNCAVCMF